MNKLAWIQRLAANLLAVSPNRGNRLAPAARRRKSLRLNVEALEDRCVPATFTVINNSDSGTGSLRQAILDANAASGADSITFSPTVNGQTITLATALPAITENLTITGPGSNGITVSGNNAVQIFTVNAGVTVTISGLTLTGGKATGDGGAILNNGGVLTLDNDIVENNTATGTGGAVANEGTSAQLTITNSTFTNNTVTAGGGAVFSNATTAQLNITGSTFSSNTALDGGAIFAAAGTTTAIVNATIVGNTGLNNGLGAGIDNAGTMTVTNSTVAQNTGTAAYSGGGLYNSGSLSLTNSAVYGNISQGSGGGIDDSGTLLAVTNSTIANNTSVFSGGGGGIRVTAGALTLLNDTITGNVDASQALTTNAGGVSFSGGGTFTIDNTIVAQNSATGTAPQPQDIRGTVASGVNNFIGDITGLVGLTSGTNGNQIGTAATPIDPKLGPLQDNGGPTFSRKPLVGSPVIDKGNNAAAGTLTTDQRGFLRIVGGTIDIGSVEFQPPQVNVTLTISPSAPIPFHAPVTLTATVTPVATGTNVPVTGTVTFLVNGTTVLGTAPVDSSGKATLTTTTANPLPLGTDQITARYDGDNNYYAGLSAAVTEQVLYPVTTPAVFDPATATWYLKNSFTSGAPDITPFQFGAPGDQPIMGDWNGDGIFTIGVFDPRTATFYLRDSNSPGTPDYTFQFGPNETDLGGNKGIAVAGDWNGDGKWSVGVFAPTRGDWNLRNELNAGLPDAGSFMYGALGSKPVVGDWNGDGKFSQGVVEPDGTWKLKNATVTGPPDFTFSYGSFADQVIAGDWNHDGIWSPGVLVNTAGALTWELRNENSAGAPDAGTFTYGGASFIGVVGDFNFPTLPQFAAGGEGAGAAAISTGDLNTIVQAALGRLQQAGVSQNVLNRLSTVTAVIQPLAAGQLGEALPAQNTIVLSPDAAGHGWFVDPTDEDFSGDTALANTPAVGHEDLLTTVLHEMGHIIGLADNSGSALMAEGLPTGMRYVDALNTVFSAYGS